MFPVPTVTESYLLKKFDVMMIQIFQWLSISRINKLNSFSLTGVVKYRKDFLEIVKMFLLFSTARMSTFFEQFTHLAHATDSLLYKLFAFMRCSLAQIRRYTKVFTREQFDVVKMKREQCHVRRDCCIFQNVPPQGCPLLMNFMNVWICCWYFHKTYHDVSQDGNWFYWKISQQPAILWRTMEWTV